MAAIPSSTETVVDPGLGIAGAVSTLPVVIGTTSSGTANSFARYSTIKALTDALGEGPGVEAAVHILATAGGPVGFVKPTTTIAASNSAVTASGGGPTVTVAGTAVVDADCRVEVIAGGALGAGTFRYSLDTFTGDKESNRTYSAVQTIPAGGTFVIPTFGITITFASGTYVAAEFYTWTSNAAASNATDLNTAMDALDATPLAWRFAYVVTSNNTGDSTAHEALGVAFQAKLNTMAANNKYRRGIIASNMDDADPTSDWSSTVADRVLVAHGRMRQVSTKSFIAHAFPTVPGASAFAARAAGSLISTDLKRVPGNGVNDGGPLPNVERVFVDERTAATGVDDFQVSTLRTYDNRPGFYITQGRLKSAAGSDFTIWARGIVMDVACETTHAIQVTFIGRGVRVNDGGTIDNRDALRLEAEVQSALDAKLTSPRNAEGTDGHASEVLYTISRTNNVLATSTVETTVAIKPLAHLDYITSNLSFVASIGVEEPAAEPAEEA